MKSTLLFFAYVGTRNDDVFLKRQWEVNLNKIGKGKRWLRTDKAGKYKKWFLGTTFVMDWEDDGKRIKNYRNPDGSLKSCPQNIQYLYKEGVSWGKVGSGSTSFRYRPKNLGFNDAAPTLFGDRDLYPILAALNSKIYSKLLKIRGETLNMTCGVVEELPLLGYDNKVAENTLHNIVDKCITLAKADWDSFETSWDFQCHPLIIQGISDFMGQSIEKYPTLEEQYLDFQVACENRFIALQDNEQKLNQIFIDLYSLQSELTPDVSDKDITVHKVFDRKENVPESMTGSHYVLTKEDVMKSLLSYAIGCLFCRYSLDTPGLAYAGGEWDDSKYQTFIPDDDNVVPITDEEYFDDDLPSFICAWLKKAFGRENFEANLEFLTDALGTRGTTPKEKLRNYFLKNFYKDHCKTYQKRPIYWLFDSGKENGFKAFVYIHRWTKDTEGRVLLYLHKVQSKYETELRAIDMNLENLSDKRRAAWLEKRKDHLLKQLAEIKDYDEILDHMANEQRIMDLDDGVKVNYEKMQTDREGVTYPILAKIK